MNIKVIEPGGFLHKGERFNEGDQRMNFDDAVGTAFCKVGWVEDLDGKVKTGKRDPNKAIVLDVQGSKHAKKTQGAG